MLKSTIYVASSWRNDYQQFVVQTLRKAGHEVYDFKHPRPGNNGFSWGDIAEKWQGWNPSEFRQALCDPIAEAGFASDWDAMVAADTCVLVLPCGRSAHIEAGYFVGAGKRLIILLAQGEPELMYKMAGHLCLTVKEVVEILEGVPA